MSGEGLVYPRFDEKNVFDDGFLPKELLDNAVLHIGVDFNVANMNAIVCIRANDTLYVIDEIQLKHANANTYSLVTEIQRRYPNRQVILYPDATGRNRSANTVDTQNTNHHILRTAGFPLRFDNSGNPPIEDRIILLNSKIRAANGNITIKVHRRCRGLIYALSTRTFKDGKPIKDNVTDHGCDCIEYVVWHNFNTRNQLQGKRM
jgi:hypothetical protein